MAEYDYQEGGFMALYFLMTFLVIILIPLSISLIPKFKKEQVSRCRCSECAIKEHQLKIGGFIASPKTLAIIALWGVVFGVAYKLAITKIESKVYDPFEILGLTPTSDEKVIKRHYKKLSVKFHPDKVRLVVNQTIEQVSSHFVDLTKAYKALTDETIRENLRLYGNPDGKQDFKVGIALPPWVIESSNNAWVLGAYAILFGGALPYLVGRWWFGSRQYTKDGVKGRTAETFFKSVTEDDSVFDVIRVLAKGWHVETRPVPATRSETELRKIVVIKLGDTRWHSLTSGLDDVSLRTLTLLYAHLLRIPIRDPTLSTEQSTLLSHTPQLLASMLSITLSHNWLAPSLHAMHLHAYLAQALLPGCDSSLQLPSSSSDNLDTSSISSQSNPETNRFTDDIRKASQHLGRLEILDVYFKVLGERIVTPGAIVQLVFQARVIPFTARTGEPSQMVSRDERHQTFLASKKDMEDLELDSLLPMAHAPHWPGDRKPHWWVFVGDPKQGRVFVPPTRFTDVPFIPLEGTGTKAMASSRLYKLTFQAPATPGPLAFQIHFVSDTFLGDDIRRNLILKVEDVSALSAEEQQAEDDISDPEEDSLAGQMAALRGGSVKRSPAYGEDDEEEYESTTDGEQSTDGDSDSDSD